MERTVQLYISGVRVDLFKDEQITVTSSIQNTQDISKVFTDFSQTFTLPASTVNNNLFSHYYQSDVDNGTNANVRIAARIEIDYTPFRVGLVQLEGSEVKNNQVESYKVTFFGEVTTLKDLFGEDKLSNLDYSAVNEAYTGAAVETAIQTTSDVDVRYPLISSSRVWNNSADDANDITTDNTRPLAYTELFPALKDSVIFAAIAAKYGVTFNGIFLTDKRFTNLFTWWKNKATGAFESERRDVVFGVSGTKPLKDSIAYIEYKEPSTLTYVATPTSYTNLYQKVWIYIMPDAAVDYSIHTYKNGTWISNTNETNVSAMHQMLFLTGQNQGLADEYTYKITTDGAVTLTGTIIHQYQSFFQTASGATNETTSQIEGLTSMTFNGDMDWNVSAPDIKVADYFSGVLKMFNLTCYPTDNLTFQIEPLEDWFAKGLQTDITQYVDVKSITYDRVKLHKEILFKYKTSKSFLNEAFKESWGRFWGSLKDAFNYDGTPLKIEPPFENIQFSNLDSAKFQVGYSLTKAPDYKPYLPSPVKLYLYEQQNCSFYFNNGSTVPQLTDYMPMGQDVSYNGINYSLNFGNEYSTLLLTPIEDSLYKTYYQRYLVNLFSTKNRKVTLKAILPLSLLTDMNLNDNLIIRDKKYRIETMKSNLVTGLVDFVLMNDFTTNRRVKPPVVPPLIDAGSLGPIVIPIRPPRRWKITVRADTGAFTTPTPSLPKDFTVDGTVSFAFTANTTHADRVDLYYLDYYDETDTLIESVPVELTQAGDWDWINTESNLRILTEDLNVLVSE